MPETAVQERRERLLAWMADLLFAVPRAVIVETSGLYVERNITDNLQQRCQRDLRALESEGKLVRLPGRPTRWMTANRGEAQDA